jgi:hypothetical protein
MTVKSGSSAEAVVLLTVIPETRGLRRLEHVLVMVRERVMVVLVQVVI